VENASSGSNSFTFNFVHNLRLGVFRRVVSENLIEKIKMPIEISGAF
jgi:hypothetical protein